MKRPTVSIIVPVLNEESTICTLLDHLQSRGADELIVVDGKSTDRTVELITEQYPNVKILQTDPSRGGQMNAGAFASNCDVFLFMHADCSIESGTVDEIRDAMTDPEVLGGNLNIRFGGGDWVADFFDWVNTWRRKLGMFYGDSGIFCRRSTFEKLNGYRPWPIMEDYDFGRRMWKAGRLAYCQSDIYVSDRRWRSAGLSPTMVNWILIQALYTFGVSPFFLGKMYRVIR